MSLMQRIAVASGSQPMAEDPVDRATPDVAVTIVMPCLNEIQSLLHCIGNARAALDELSGNGGLTGEIVIADNGSTDGSQQLATTLGARVVDVGLRGYGAALIGGCKAAHGRFILMGDCDGSYDFTEGVAMVRKLDEGHDLCMGSRFSGGIAPGAMPWKNRYIGNPALSGILNLFFRSGVSDAHCGLRAIRKDAFLRLHLTGSGMEFASEMVIKASLLKLKMAEVPATLSVDLRERPPHLRPWRDGWRHLRYLFMLSPTWVFGAPALTAFGIGLIILAAALAEALGGPSSTFFGDSWTVIGAMLVAVGHIAAIMVIASHLYGVRQGYRLPKTWMTRWRPLLSLEGWLIAGATSIATSVVALAGVVVYWGQEGFAAFSTILPVTLAGLLGVLGLQTVLGGFLLAVLGGNEAEFLPASKDAR